MTTHQALIKELRRVHQGHTDEGPSTFSDAANALQSQAERIKELERHVFALSGEVANKADYAARMYRMHEDVSAQLAALLSVITMSDGPERIALATEKADPAVRKKPALFFASYCPMCGVKLDGNRLG